MPKPPKSRRAQDLRRRPGTRVRYDRVLIVCEGQKTECNYFEEIRIKARIPTARIHVLPSAIGTDPKSVVQSAEDLFHSKGKCFERIYAVFDRDDHLEYANAIHMAEARRTRFRNEARQAVTFEAIVSVPCFELWLLPHFVDVQVWMHRDKALSDLKVHIPGYTKGMTNVYDNTEPNLSTAVNRAMALKSRFQRIPGDEPYTDIHELVVLLLNLRRPR